MDNSERRLLERTHERLKNFESDVNARLSRLEENLRLLRQDLIGDGQPGRISRLEVEMNQIRDEHHRQRGILAAISFIVSAGVALFARLFDRG